MSTEILETENFLQVSEYIQRHYGIQLPVTKKKMVEARLQKRLKALNLDSFKHYFEYVFGGENHAEYVQMIDLLTTNKTEFFRESAHFDFLSSVVLPEFLASNQGVEPMNIWSAAAATGEEVYSILITLEEYFYKGYSRCPYSIVGTDLSTQVLKKAVAAIYSEDKIASLPLTIKKRYFLKSKDRQNPRARIMPELLKHVEFKRLNLLEPYAGMQRKFDVIFCRNVLIYFDRTVQQRVITKLVDQINPDGYLFIGHAESLTNMQLPLKQIKPTIYKKIRP